MRWTSFGVWMLLNMMLMGMSGYMYLLWMQYWRYSKYSRVSKLEGIGADNFPINFDGEEIIMKEGRPRFKPRDVPTEDFAFIFPQAEEEEEAKEKPKASKASPPMTSTVPTTTTTTTFSPKQLRKMVEKHKLQMTVELRSAQMDGGNTLFKHENKYGVKFRGRKARGETSKETFRCALSRAMIRSLRDGDEPFTSEGMGKYFYPEGILEGRYFNSCAIVTSAGSLKDSNLGKFIDSHDAVMRFNHAPTKKFEKDVGSKTTMRLINSQVVTKAEFDFWGSSLYKNVTLLVWDPSNYTHSLSEWYGSPDFPVFSDFFRRRLMLPKEELHLLHPGSLWRLWDVMQTYTHTKLLPNPPSSGFLGMVLLLHHCQSVSIAEYVPSVLRLTKQCHYWNNYTDVGCTFGGWHPLATEKMFALLLNAAGDFDTYVKGYVTVPGFNQGTCPTE